MVARLRHGEGGGEESHRPCLCVAYEMKRHFLCSLSSILN
jgi:hypothetical protein